MTHNSVQLKLCCTEVDTGGLKKCIPTDVSNCSGWIDFLAYLDRSCAKFQAKLSRMQKYSAPPPDSNKMSLRQLLEPP